MRFDLLTIFPHMLDSMVHESILARAQEAGHIEFHAHNIRDYATDKHKTVDDTPYGGGQGMVMKVEPIHAALQAIPRKENARVVLLSAKGRRLTQAVAQEYADTVDQMIFVCGRYEGVDERVRNYIDDEISIGDYVLTGGELGAAVVIDAVARLLPGVLGHELSAVEETHSTPGYIEHPQYTRPVEYDGHQVPDVLRSGDHGAIDAWRHEQSTSLAQKKD